MDTRNPEDDKNIKQDIEHDEILEQTAKEIEELVAQARDGSRNALTAMAWSNWQSFKKHLDAGHLDCKTLGYVLLTIFEKVAEATSERDLTKIEEDICFFLVQAVRVHEAQLD